MSWTNSIIPVAEWMKGLLNLNIPDSAIQSLLIGRGIDGLTPVRDLTLREAELLKADLWVWFCTSPSTGQSVSDSDGDWSHKEGSYSLLPADKKLLLQMANDIYAKWDEPLVIRPSTVRLINL